ncbi:DNA translocase FtsK [Legionella yabuuchiae]|uniref:DNA translocase FtsK n=1 Tax=Legionella yabuuchiae TaxID=376727 RepID=UPI0010550D32|nr:DNA translocase FtsK [Legionella yabuuchiae]
MTNKNKNKKASDPKSAMPHYLVKRISEGSFILVLTLALYTLLSLITYRQNDPGWTHMGPHPSHITNAGGQVGAYISDGLYFCFGYLAYLIPLCFAYVGWVILKDHLALRKLNKAMLMVRAAGLIFLLCGGCGLLALELKITANAFVNHTGGVVGELMASMLRSAFNPEGATLILIAMILVGVTWLTGLSWVLMTEMVGRYTLIVIHWLVKSVAMATNALSFLGNNAKDRFNRPTHTPNVSKPIIRTPEKAQSEVKLIQESKLVESSPPVKEKSVKKVAVIPGMPALSLLSKGQPGKPMGGYTHQELETLSRDVEQHLLDFGIQADVVSVHPGPVITRFELQLAAGVKVSKLTALSKDLARSLSVTSVRVVEIIPGKTVVGLELPNQDRATVSLSEVLSADVYQKAHSSLTLALGVDIAGHPMVVDLAKMPHLLVAGTTGSGKSVGINAMILSLLYKASPEQVRLIMVDPKMLELSVYDGIPHLLAPVVTDMKEAASALRWCVGEMERRYRLMASFGVRNLAGFNSKVAEAKAKGQPLVDPLWKPNSSATEDSAPELNSLPYIVVVIDELADMMMVVGKKVEQLIARIAQKARAAGIHLILATQRPSVDVLTGLIKSNIPTRISFQVSSKIDSRTILDQQGAEQLLGYGDMLFLAPGTGAPLRVHGAFVDDKEVHRVADDWRARGVPEYIDEITQNSGDGFDGIPGEEGQDTEDADPLYDQAVEFVIETRKASISAVQRRFKIGYNRAARLVEEMERAGLVGPLEGGFRDVLVNSIDD